MRRGVMAVLLMMVIGGLGAAVAVASGHSGPRHHRHPFPPQLPPGRLLLHGDLAHPRVLSISDLAALPQQTETITFKAGAGTETHVERGPLLSDVLALGMPAFDPAVKNDKLRHYVAATGRDDYQAVVAWGEFDPEFEAKPILLSIEEDGQPLTDDPRLVVPGDARGGRAVSDVVDLFLGQPRLG